MSSGEFTNNYAIDERKIRVAIADKCNLHCNYCDQGLQRSKTRTGAMEDFRSSDMNADFISTNEYLRLMSSLRESGYSGVTFTGGEPLLNPDWPELVVGARKLGFSNVRLTTNGLLINKFLQYHDKFPDELNLLTVSLDTFDDNEFNAITGGHITKVLSGIEAVKLTNPKLQIKANKVVMRNNLDGLAHYIQLCEQTGVIEQLTLLNLVCKDPLLDKERSFFGQQFVPPSEILEALSQYSFNLDAKHEYITVTPEGLTINLMDTTRSLRAEECNDCPIFCQEGLFTTRVATDGTIRTCADFHNKLPFIKSNELSDSELRVNIENLLAPSRRVELVDKFAEFCIKHSIKPQRLT